MNKLFSFVLALLICLPANSSDHKNSAAPSNPDQGKNLSLTLNLPKKISETPFHVSWPDKPLDFRINIPDAKIAAETLQNIKAKLETKLALDLNDVKANVKHDVTLPAQLPPIPPIQIQAPQQPIQLAHTLHVTPETSNALEIAAVKCPAAIGCLASGSTPVQCCLMTILLLPYAHLKEGMVQTGALIKRQLDHCRRKQS